MKKIGKSMLFLSLSIILYANGSTCKIKQDGLSDLTNKSLVVKYSLTRKLISGDSIFQEQIISNGVIYKSPSYSLNQNERVLYIRENGKCLIYLKKFKQTIELDTLNSITYLLSEPANDLFLLERFLSKEAGTYDNTNKNISVLKYFIGKKSRNTDSIYIMSSLEKKYPDSIVYIGKQIGRDKSLIRSYVVDVLQLHSFDTLPIVDKISIKDFLRSDSIKKKSR